MNGMILAWTFLGFCSALDDYDPASRSQLQKQEERSINPNDLPDKGQYKVAPYLRAAALLQEMGKEKACEQLVKLANKDDEHRQVAFLCRLLFTKRGGGPFRGPLLGGPNYMGRTSENDWPLLPIEIVDDVPFFIVSSYQVGGLPEPSLLYLDYCLRNCEWSKTRFGHVNDKSVEKALNKLLASKKWKRPLTDYERRLLISQTKKR
jgi:hypothetical protein